MSDEPTHGDETVSKPPKIKRAVLAACLMLGVASGALGSCGPEQASTTATADFPYGLTQKGAEAFIAKAETDLMAMGEYASRASWVMNNLHHRGHPVAAGQGERRDPTRSRRAMRARRRASTGSKPTRSSAASWTPQARHRRCRRPRAPGAAQELATINSRLEATYSTGKFSHKGKQITLDDAEEILRTSRDPAELQAVWEGWHGIAPPMQRDYARLVALANEGARELGYSDTGAIWRSGYDMAPDAFAAKMDALWEQVEPLLQQSALLRARPAEREVRRDRAAGRRARSAPI